MTYKQIVDNIKDIVDRHHMLADFGYGQISDIKTGGDDGEANYPYAFLNPQTHTRSERSINYRFNLIVMDMYIGDDFLTAQSQCQEYIDDILADMKYAVQEYDVVINVTLTPFKERFQDVVGGMTATIELELPQKLNLCIAPINNDVLLIDVNTNVEESGDQFHQALRVGPADFVNYPEYDEQSNEFAPWFWKQGAYDYSNRIAPLVLNDFESDEQPYYTFVTREVRIPAGVTGTFRFEYDLELTNIQGIEFPEDLFRIQVVINGSETFDDPIPALPLNGDIVDYKRQFTYVATEQTEDVRILFRYRDEGTPAPSGPLVGYRGNFKLYLEE